jgi:hypothetical protein
MAPEDVLKHILTSAVSTQNWQETVGPWLESSPAGKWIILSDYIAALRLNASSLRLSPPMVRGSTAKILVSAKGDSTPFMAKLFLRADGQWRLGSFDYQCPACFGDGVLGNYPDWELCVSCGATGWGDDSF